MADTVKYQMDITYLDVEGEVCTYVKTCYMHYPALVQTMEEYADKGFGISVEDTLTYIPSSRVLSIQAIKE